MGTELMSRRESHDLMSVVRMNAKVTKAAVDSLAAERKAQVEVELSTIHREDDVLWSEITAAADRANAAADAEIAAICLREGIREQFRPRLSHFWSGRGENGLPARRAELRRRAYARIEADQKTAYQKIDLWAAERCTRLVAGQLTSEDAKQFLASLPSPEQLLPPVQVRGELGDGSNDSITVSTRGEI